jgi:hypothetical protein
MTKAKITRPQGYRCSPNGATVEFFEAGTIVTGKVAEWALADHAANRMFEPREELKVETQLEVKAPRKRTRKGTK